MNTCSPDEAGDCEHGVITVTKLASTILGISYNHHKMNHSLRRDKNWGQATQSTQQWKTTGVSHEESPLSSALKT
jgi:hypothetical protein